jgi:hypothetical protein
LTRQAFDADEPLLAKVAQVARARISPAAVVVSQVPCGDHPEGANGREAASLRPSERIRPPARVVDDLALRSARQIEIAHEDIARIQTARLVIALGPPPVLRVAATIAGIILRVA